MYGVGLEDVLKKTNGCLKKRHDAALTTLQAKASTSMFCPDLGDFL